MFKLDIPMWQKKRMLRKNLTAPKSILQAGAQTANGGPATTISPHLHSDDRFINVRYKSAKIEQMCLHVCSHVSAFKVVTLARFLEKALVCLRSLVFLIIANQPIVNTISEAVLQIWKTGYPRSFKKLLCYMLLARSFNLLCYVLNNGWSNIFMKSTTLRSFTTQKRQTMLSPPIDIKIGLSFHSLCARVYAEIINVR